MMVSLHDPIKVIEETARARVAEYLGGSPDLTVKTKLLAVDISEVQKATGHRLAC